MATNEEILAKLVVMDGKLDTLVKKGSSAMALFESGTYQPPAAPIPNGEDDPPKVWAKGVVTSEAFYKIPGIGGRWYARWPSNNAVKVALIRPFTAEEIKAMFTDCGQSAPDADVYHYDEVVDEGKGWVLSSLGWNPLAEVPDCCKE